MREEYQDEIDLMRVFEIIKKKLVLFIVIVVICATATFAYTKLCIEKTYTATATVIIVQKNDNVSNNSVTMSDVQLSQKLVSTYQQIIMSEAISDKVIANLDLDEYGISTKEYKEIVKVSPAGETEVMNISVETTDPKLSASIANEVVDVFQNKIYDIMQIENVSVLNNAKVPTAKSGPSTTKNMMLGIIFGAVICAIITLKEVLTDTKIKTEEELKEIFDYPIIGIIPEFEIEDNNAGGKKK